MTKNLKYFVLLIFLLQNLISAQIKVTSLPQNSKGIFDQIFFDKNEFRNVELLDDDWTVHLENDSEKRIRLSVPAVFEGNNILIFEKKITLTQQQIQNSQIIAGFLGINYSCEISVNGYNIYKHPGGSVPFEISLPKDILKEKTTLTVKVNSKLNSENSIPSAYKFMYSSLSGGIIRDVYLKVVSPVHISAAACSTTLDPSFTKAFLNFNIGIENSFFSKASQNFQSQNILIRVNVYPNTSQVPVAKGDFLNTISSENSEINVKLEVNNPSLWSPEAPQFYLYEISLLRDGQLIDKTVKSFSVFKLKKDNNNFSLNGNPFAFQGTTYYLDETSLRRMIVYDKLKDDLTLIKNTGFNAVRFSKSYPHPYVIQLCQELGMFALIELPLNSIPEEILSEEDFQLSVLSRTKSYLSGYSGFGNTFCFGAGSSFLPNSEITEKFIKRLIEPAREKGIPVYASFIGIQRNPIENLDLYGVELFSTAVDTARGEIQKGISSLGKNSYFISEMSYPNYYGSQSGYLAKFSSDAQAKYFREMIDLAREAKISGFFINSLFDYKGEFASLYGGYSSDLIYKLGILDSRRNLSSIGYKVLVSKLSNDAKVTIPIGTRKEDSSIIFIVLALALTLVMAVLVNIKKKFKEDCTRALLRPYNFYADIRDHRIMSGIHTTILMFIQAGAASLLVTVLLYYFRSNILLEKLFLSFGHHSLMKLISYLAWNPASSFLFFMLLIMFKFVLVSSLIKFASFFIKTKVEFLSILFMVIWSFLPFTILLPLEAVLFKLLTMVSFNTLIYVFLILFFFWILQRILKGIYVVFDVMPLKVYLWSTGVIFLFIGGLLLKYQISNSIIFYINNSIKQYHSMIF